MNVENSLDLDWIRSQFPALSIEVAGGPAVFLDAPGGTQVPQQVVSAVSDALVNANANTHGAFLTSQRVDQIIAAAHQAAGDFLGCDADEVVFGPNMTSLTFSLSRAMGRALKPGDEIVLTYLDHDANFAPWKALEETGAVIRVADFRREDCTLDIDQLLGLINHNTKIVAVGYASNSVGSINDVAQIAAAAKAVGAYSFIDAVHYAPHGPIDVRAIGCDFLACSAYKFFGPHQGILYGRRELLERLRPYKVRPASDEPPWRWETGTQNHEAMAGVTAAVDYLAALGERLGETGARRQQLQASMHATSAYERRLSEKLIAGLLDIPSVEFFGIRELERFSQRTPTVSIRVQGLSPRDVVERLAELGFFVWEGNYYALNLSERLGVESSGGMIRIGCAHYNTLSEIDRLLAAIETL
ncbi:MAG: cysteine desulfurase-like protein [Acidobacteria bacterium]|nr:cysteine desulfurase-like protein [Acidobacteriota bacterium]MDA1233346.1 cysteine desulfurase-like protein [Acidobacteriota bacterium]